jgi:alanine dehydrogenase
LIIGVPKEIKNHEYRVGLIPSGVQELVRCGHTVYIEDSAGIAINYSNAAYIKAGAVILATAAEIFAIADIIVKVKEPQAQERKMLRSGQILFTYLHLAADKPQTEGLLASDCVAIAYETVSDDKGGLPLLAPMSEIAGRLSIQAGTAAMESPHGGVGMLIGGVPGVKPANVVIIGGGVVGINAARMARGMGADVSILDNNLTTLRKIDVDFLGTVKTIYSNSMNLEKAVLAAHLIVGAVLIPGAAAPTLISRAMLKHMKPKAVLVDVAIDQGGCFESSIATTHDQPSYIIDNIIHYCVANMPGAVAKTSTTALTNATMPFVMALANKGWRAAISDSIHLRAGVNVCHGQVTYPAVAATLGYQSINIDTLL